MWHMLLGTILLLLLLCKVDPIRELEPKWNLTGIALVRTDHIIITESACQVYTDVYTHADGPNPRWFILLPVDGDRMAKDLDKKGRLPDVRAGYTSNNDW